MKQKLSLIMFKKIKQFVQENKYKILAGISFGFAGYAFYKYMNDDNRIKLSAFLQALQANQLDEVVIKADTVYFRSHISDWYYSNIGAYPLSMLFQQLKKSPQLKYGCEQDDPIAKALLALLLSTGSTIMILKYMLPQQLGTSNKNPTIVHNNQNFQNFFGSQEIKLKLKEIAEYLKNKSKFQKLGGRIRKGILLYGPPGTGKTMLAKTLANQTGLPFIQTCASQFQEIYVGVGPKKIRQIFQRAKSCPQGCIVFIDQLDAIGSRSEGNRFSRQTTATINQLLTQLDGFQQNQNVVVIGATNRVDLVDTALIRAGRFDIKVKLHLPNAFQRKGIFQTLLKKKGVPHNITEQTENYISQSSQGWSGADMQALINEAIYKAIRQNMESVQSEPILQAFRELKQKLSL